MRTFIKYVLIALLAYAAIFACIMILAFALPNHVLGGLPGFRGCFISPHFFEDSIVCKGFTGAPVVELMLHVLFVITKPLQYLWGFYMLSRG